MSDSVIQKIQKVLELARRGGTEAESETAMKMALELLAKHNLSMSDVEREEIRDEDVVEEKSEGEVTNGWRGIIWQSIAPLYFCKYYKSLYRMGGKNFASYVLVGRKDNVDVAKQVISYLISLGDELSKPPAGKDRFWSYSFRNAYCTRISHRAYEQRREATTKVSGDNTCTALMVVNLYALTAKENDNFLTKQGVRLRTVANSAKTKKVWDGDGYAKGDAAGRSVSLKGTTAKGRIGH